MSSLLHWAQIGYESQGTSHPMVPGVLPRGINLPECKISHSHPFTFEVKNAWSYTSTPPQFSIAWSLIKCKYKCRHSSIILILSFHLWLGIPNDVFPSGFPTKTLYIFLIFSMRATCPACLIFLNLIILITFGGG